MGSCGSGWSRRRSDSSVLTSSRPVPGTSHRFEEDSWCRVVESTTKRGRRYPHPGCSLPRGPSVVRRGPSVGPDVMSVLLFLLNRHRSSKVGSSASDMVVVWRCLDMSQRSFSSVKTVTGEFYKVDLNLTLSLRSKRDVQERCRLEMDEER